MRTEPNNVYNIEKKGSKDKIDNLILSIDKKSYIIFRDFLKTPYNIDKNRFDNPKIESESLFNKEMNELNSMIEKLLVNILMFKEAFGLYKRVNNPNCKDYSDIIGLFMEIQKNITMSQMTYSNLNRCKDYYSIMKKGLNIITENFLDMNIEL